MITIFLGCLFSLCATSSGLNAKDLHLLLSQGPQAYIPPEISATIYEYMAPTTKLLKNIDRWHPIKGPVRIPLIETHAIVNVSQVAMIRATYHLNYDSTALTPDPCYPRVTMTRLDRSSEALEIGFTPSHHDPKNPYEFKIQYLKTRFSAYDTKKPYGIQISKYLTTRIPLNAVLSWTNHFRLDINVWKPCDPKSDDYKTCLEQRAKVTYDPYAPNVVPMELRNNTDIYLELPGECEYTIYDLTAHYGDETR